MQLQTHDYSIDTLLLYIIIKSSGITTQTRHSNTNAACSLFTCAWQLEKYGIVHVIISAGDNFAIFLCIDGVRKISVWKPVLKVAVLWILC